MPVTGERPESGVRIEIARPKSASGADAGPWIYEGAAHTPDATFPARVTVSGTGDVEVHLDASEAGETAPKDLAEKVRLIVRTAHKQAKADGEPPPLRITRWRGNK